MIAEHSGQVPAVENSRTLRILHVSTRFNYGGAERNIANTLAWERRRGHEVHLAAGLGAIPSEVPEGIALHVLPHLRRAINPLYDIRAARALRQLIREHGFDVVHTHESKAGVVGRLAAAGRVPVVIHTIHMASFGRGYPPHASAAFLAVERFCARFTSYYVTVGNELRNQYLANGVGFPRQYITIHSPIDVEGYGKIRQIPPSQRTALRERFGFRQDAPLLVSIGRLEPRKRHNLALERLAPLLRDGRVQFALAGEGPELSSLRGLCIHLGVEHTVRMVGQISNVEDLLACADLVIHVSRVEGVSQVVMQALAAGVPVVATSVEGLREVEGASVTIIDRDGIGLADAVQRAIEAPPEPVPLRALAPWTLSEVDRRLEVLHELINECLGARP